MELKKKLMIALYVIIIVVILLGTLYIKTINENEKCTGDPFVYGAKKIAEGPQEVEVSCTCMFDDPNYANFYFNKDGLEVGLGEPGMRISKNISFTLG